jgi:Domain of unknown function (DUF4221)
VTNKILLFSLSSIVFFLVASCSRIADVTTRRSYTHNLVVSKDKLELIIDDSTSFESNYYQVVENRGVELLLIQSKHKNSIQFYSLESRQRIKELKFPREGSAPIRQIHGFSWINRDSIMVFDKWRSNGILVDSNGLLINNIVWKSDEKSFNHASMNRLPNVTLNGKIYIFEFPNISLDSEQLFSNDVKFEYVYDIKTKKGEYLDFSWPEIYKGKSWGFYHTVPSNVKGKNDFLVYSFGIDHNLQVLKPDGTIETHEARSDYFDSIDPIRRNEDETVAFLKRGIYAMVMYDKYRNVYYRVAGLETKHVLPNGKPKADIHKPYSIIILDENFNKIGETVLEPLEQFLIKDWFVCREGLCISSANPLNKEIDESKMTFHVLKLDKVQP